MPSKNARILVVDGHADMLALLKRLLRQQGYDVLTADSLAGGVRVGEMSEFDVLITDLQLPDGWGWTIVQRVRASGRRFNAIAVSGHRFDSPLGQCDWDEFSARLTKPVDFKQLFDTVERCVPVGAR